METAAGTHEVLIQGGDLRHHGIQSQNVVDGRVEKRQEYGQKVADVSSRVLAFGHSGY